MDRIAVEVGSIQIYWYSIFIFLGLLVGSILIIVGLAILIYKRIRYKK